MNYINKKIFLENKLKKNPKKIRKIFLPERIKIDDLVKALKTKEVKIKNIINKLNLNIKKIINWDDAIILADFFKIFAYKKKKNNCLLEEEENIKNLIKRPIIISIMGHVDHGKTSLLKNICEDKKIKNEDLGITQNIEIYKTKKKNIDIFFLDTPGHEDFDNFRKNGIKITDMIILVIAVNTGIMKQTKEIIEYTKKFKIPLIVNLNKIDIENCKSNSIINELISNNIIPEEYMGECIFTKTSAKTKEGVKNLIDNIILLAEIIDPKININKIFKATIIECKKDINLGFITTIVIKSGCIKTGDKILIGWKIEVIKLIYNIDNNIIKKTDNETIVKIIGIKTLLNIGEVLISIKNEKIIKKIALFRKYKIKIDKKSKKNIKNKKKLKRKKKTHKINLIIKSETYNILETIKKSIIKLNSKKFKINLINISTGGININDIKLASITNSDILGFDLKIKNEIIDISKKYKIIINNYKTIYDLIKYIKDRKIIYLNKENVIIGIAQINKIFKMSDGKIIAGGVVIKGKIKLKSIIKIKRNEKIIFEGIINSLKCYKEEVLEVKENLEFGLYIKKFNKFVKNDIIEFYKNT